MTKVMNEEICAIVDSWEAWMIVRESSSEIDVAALEDCSPEDDALFFLHQGSFYNLNEFMAFKDPDREECLLDYHFFVAWTYFSGIALKYLTEDEVKVAVFYNG